MGCCPDCTAGRLARYLVSASGSLCATNYSEQIAMILDFTEICIGTSMTHEKPHLFEQHRKDLLFLLFKQFGIDTCTPLLPWQEKVLSMLALREESRREWADAIAQPLPVTMDAYLDSYFKMKKNNTVF